MKTETEIKEKIKDIEKNRHNLDHIKKCPECEKLGAE
jgi:hypothetical protein